MSKTRWIAVIGVIVLAVVGFLLFRPDTFFTEVRAEEDLADAFTSTTRPTSPSGPSSAGSTPTTDAASSTSLITGDPVVVSTGSLQGIDHQADGTTTVYEQNGRFVLRFEDDTDIQNGPDLYVWLLPTETYEGGTPSEYVDLGTLKGTVGGQNYELPADFEAGGRWTVLVWCLRFAVPFAAAELG